MGGHVLELESEKRARLMAEAKEQAEALGREQGMAQGMAPVSYTHLGSICTRNLS